MTASDHSYETSGDRASLAREAGVGKLSFISVLAGTLVAYGAFAVLAALLGAAAAAIGLDNDLSRNDWARLGTGSAILPPWSCWLRTCSAGTWPAAWLVAPACSTGWPSSSWRSCSSLSLARSSPVRPTLTPSAPTCAALASRPRVGALVGGRPR
jgi:hypothetical protein